MKKVYSSLLFLFCMLTLSAQQIGIYSHEFYKPMITNPAFTGNSDYINAMLISRLQWIDFKNAPQLNIFTLDGKLPSKKMAVGIDLFSDKKGISNKIGGNAYYSYRILLNENTKLQFGIALGLMDHSLRYSEAIVEDPSDPFLIGTSQKETTINSNAGLGFIWKELEAGISVPQLLGGSLEYQDNNSGKAYYALSRHYLGSLKYKFVLSESKQISLSPMGIMHFHPNVPIQYDANLNLEWKDKFWIGATYKSDYAVSANAGFCISKQFYIGYSYDIIIGNIGKYSGMSHELMMNFIFGKVKQQEEKSPDALLLPSKDKADSLQAELEIKDNKIQNGQERIKDLNEELTKLKTENENLKKVSVQAADPLQNNANQNALTIAANSAKTMENGVWITSAKTNEFNYLNGKPAEKGFYLIAGTFFYRDFAEAELKRIKSQGYLSANMLFSSSRQFNYVVVSFHSNKEQALKQVAKIKAGGVKDAWILSVQE